MAKALWTMSIWPGREVMPLTSEVQRKAGESQKSTQVGLLCRELTNIISQLKIGGVIKTVWVSFF